MEKIVLISCLLVLYSCSDNAVDILETNYNPSDYSIFYYDIDSNAIYTSDINSTNPTCLLKKDRESYYNRFIVSKDRFNKKLIYELWEDQKTYLVVRDINTNVEVRKHMQQAFGYKIILTPDNKKIIYNHSIDKAYHYIVDLNLENKRFLFTSNYGLAEDEISWKNNDSFLTSQRELDDTYSIYEYNLDGNVKKIIAGLEFANHIKLSPNQKQIAFFKYAQGYDYICIVNIDGSGEKELCKINYKGVQLIDSVKSSLTKTSNNKSHLCPDVKIEWTENGEYIIFSYFGLYMIKTDGSELIEISEHFQEFQVLDNETLVYLDYMEKKLISYNYSNGKRELFYQHNARYLQFWEILPNY